MIPNATQTTHHVENIDEAVKMQIDTSALTHLMTILTDLYSDPILAVIREYSTNALDSHIDAGNKAPIEITLPTSVDPTFKVRDYGVGLNVGDIRDIYSMYGKSTKQSSNDVTGMLGLGCKSGLTYALSFTVTGVKDGLKTIAAVTKDEEGVGVIKILDTAATTEKNGVLITIPVKGYDITRFNATAQDLFKFWRPGLVLVDGVEVSFPTKGLLWIDKDIAVFSKAQNRHMEDRIVMGGVPYPFSANIPGIAVVAWVPMGAVNFTPSREALHFTTLTKQTIKDIVDFTKERLPIVVADDVKKAKTPYEELKVALVWWQFAAQALKGHWVGNGYMAMKDPYDHPAWEVAIGGRTYASKRAQVAFSHLVGDNPIVTDFPLKSVSQQARHRLEQKFGKDVKVLMLPADADTSILRGRDKVYTWDDVVNSTVKPVIANSGGGGYNKTTYAVWHKASRTFTEKITATDAPIVYTTGYKHYRFDDVPEVRGVVLTQRQVDKFKRLHPKAMDLSTYKAKRLEKVRKKLNDKDLLVAGDLSNYIVLRNRQDELLDPTLKEAVKISSGHRSAALLEYIRLAGGSHNLPQNPIHAELAKKYPLLRHFRYANAERVVVDDLIVAINNKYTATGGK